MSDKVRGVITGDVFTQVESTFDRRILVRVASEIRLKLLGSVYTNVRLQRLQLLAKFNEH